MRARRARALDPSFASFGRGGGAAQRDQLVNERAARRARLRGEARAQESDSEDFYIRRVDPRGRGGGRAAEGSEGRTASGQRGQRGQRATANVVCAMDDVRGGTGRPISH